MTQRAGTPLLTLITCLISVLGLSARSTAMSFSPDTWSFD